MKKRTFPLYSMIALVVSLVPASFLWVADIMSDKNTYFYFGESFFTGGLFFLCVALVAILWVSALAVFLHRNMAIWWLRILIVLPITGITVWFVVMVLLVTAGFMPHHYVEIQSEDGEHTIVIGEDCYFFSPYGGDVFEKTSLCTMKKLEKYVAKEDFHTPFSDGNYSVIWNDENFELFYDSDGDGENDEKLLIEYLP